jgi:hypothetical protein
MTSPVHLQQLPQLRDYSKAPFFFALILLAAWIVKRPLSLRVQLPLAGLVGLFAGLGLGFRQDVSIAAALFCGLVAFFSPGPIKQNWWKRGAVIAVFIAAFAVLGWPIFQVLSRVNNATHDTIIGFTKYCDQRLGVEAPLYDFGDPFLDEYVRAILMGYAHRTTGRTEVFRHYSPDYDAAGKAYFREMALTFPADLIIRGYASVLRTVDELQISTADGTPRGITNQFLARLWQLRRWALDALPGAGRYHVALMLLFIAAINPRAAAALFCSILLLAGYPALRFSERHAFHMEIIALFAAGFLLHGLFVVVRAAWLRRRDFRARAFLASARTPARRVIYFAVIAMSLLILPLVAARGWQTFQVRALIEQYERADRTLLLAEASPDGATCHVALPGFGDVSKHGIDKPKRAMYEEVLVLEFSPGQAPIPVSFTFEAQHPNFQFDRVMTVPPSPETATTPTRIYYPVYFGAECRFTGFTLPGEEAGRFRGAYRLNDLGKQAILLNAIVPPYWKDLRKYQALSR